jgi:hypothetical protein
VPDWESAFERHERLHQALREALGAPVLVTDPDDGITRPTWTLEVPEDALEALCRAHNTALGWELVADSEGGQAD